MFDAVVTDSLPPGPELAQALAAVEPTTLDKRQTLCWLRSWERQSAHDESQRYRVLAHYADLHPPADDAPADDAPDGDAPAQRIGTETAISPGGAGTPAMAEFAVNDLAVAIGCTPGRAGGLLGDALALRHRMPSLFARLVAGAVGGFKVRTVLRAATGLSEVAARRLDERVTPVIHRIGPKRLEREITQCLLEADPGEAERRAQAAQETRRVCVVSDDDGDRRIFASVDAFDGAAFDAAVDHVAEILGDLGDEQLKDVRRAAAVGWLANPVAVLALEERHRAWRDGSRPRPWPTTDIGTVTDGAGETRLVPGLWRLDVPTPRDLIDPEMWPTTTLVVHIDHATWTRAGDLVPVASAAHIEGHGPVTAGQAFERLRHSQVVIKPVIDLDDEIHWVCDGPEFTGTLREAVLLANRWNPFPYADAESVGSDDIDHTVPRALGGPTALVNGGPLRRRLHRHKTFAKGWRVRQPFAGIFVWASAEGRIYVVDRRGHPHDLGYRDRPRTDVGA